MISAGTATAFLTLDRTQFSSGMKSAYQELNSFLDSSTNAGDRLQYLGGSMQSVGNMATKGITVPLVAAGATVTKFSADYETSVAKVASIADTSAVSINTLSSSILDLSEDTGVGASELNNTLYDVISAGIDTANSVEFLADATKLAKAGFAETGDSVSVLTTILNSYGLAATETSRISDILVQTQNLGVTTVAELSQSMGKAIPVYASAGLSIESLSASYVQMTKNGIGTAEATTRLSAMVNELSKSGSKTDEILKEIAGGSFRELTANGKSLGDVMNTLDEYAKSNSLSLGDLFGSSEAATAAMILAKNEGNDFNTTLNQLSNSAGATDKAFKTVSDTTQERLTKSLNKLKVSAIELGNNLLPLANDMVESFTGVVDKFNDLDDSTKKNIVSAGMYLAAAGPVLSITGKLVTGTGQLVSAFNMVSGAIGGLGLTGLTTGLAAVAIPLAAVGAGFYVWHEATDVANQSITVAREEMSWMERVIADMTGAVTYSRKELEDMGLVYKEFSDKTSKEFQDSVVGMRKDILDFNVALSEIDLDNVFDEAERNALTERVTKAVDSAISAVNTKSNEMNSAMSDLFATDGILSEEEQSIMGWWSTRGDKEIAEAQKLQEEINAIELKAFEEGRVLSGEEIAAIENRYAQIKQIELLAKAKNNEELLYAQKEFETQVVGLDAQAASDLLVQKKQQSDEILQQKKVEIEVLKAQAMQGYDEMSIEDQKRVDDTLALYDKSYLDLVAQQDGYYQDSLEFLKSHNENAYNEINRYTGEILKKQDRTYYDSLVKHREHYSGMDQITKDGMYTVQNTETGSWETIYAKVDETTGELVGVYNYNTQELGAMSKADSKILDDERTEFYSLLDSVRNSLYASSQVYADTEGNIRDSSGQIVGHIKSVKDENGKLMDSIFDLNGNPIDLGDNTDKVIKGLQETERVLGGLNGKTANTYVNNYETTYKSTFEKVNYEYVNGQAVQKGYATGTTNALPGIAQVAEYGPELIKSRSGEINLATGRQLYNMSGGETVYNARQTQDLLSNSPTNQEGLEKVVANLSDVLRRSISDLSDKVEKIQTGLNLNITEFNNNTDKDIEGLMEEMSFYIQRNNIGRA